MLAFLTMSGAETISLTYLMNLKFRYPRQQYTKNMRRQGWIGRYIQAEKYADSTIRIYAFHPQANMAKCLMKKAKGNIPAAIEAAKKAISKSYSTEKKKLGKLGYD